LKYVSTETDAKHEPLGLETRCLLMHVQYTCPSQQLIIHMFNLKTHEHEWLAHCKEIFSKFGHLNPIVVKTAVVLFNHFSADLLKEDFNYLFVVPPLKF
jgi:hypothetical protein